MMNPFASDEKISELSYSTGASEYSRDYHDYDGKKSKSPVSLEIHLPSTTGNVIAI